MKRRALLLLAASALFAAEPLRRAPGFSLPDLQLEQHDLQDYAGQVVLIEFMRTDCPHCQTLTKTLAGIQQKFAGKIQILYIVNPPDNQNTVSQYKKEHPVRGPILFDSGQVTASYARVTPSNPTVHLPQLFVIDANGKIRKQIVYDTDGPALEPLALEATVEAALKPAR